MRVAHWADRMAEFVEAARTRPFEWGTWDCCQFAAEAVLALTGADHRTAFPTYASEQEALDLIAGHGGLESLLSTVLGDSKPPARAQRGDIVLADFGDGLAAGLCLGVSCCAVSPRGLVFKPTRIATAAWSV